MVIRCQSYELRNNRRAFTSVARWIGLLAFVLSNTGDAFGAAGAQAIPTRAVPTQAIPAQAQQPESITLDRAISLAKQYNYQLNISRAEVSRAQKLVDAAVTDGLPQFTAICLPSVPEFTSPHQPNIAFIGIAAQPVTQLYRVAENVRFQNLDKEQAKQNVRLNMQQIVNSVKLSYFSVLEREDALKSLEQQIRYLTELTHVVEEQVVRGAALDVDLLEVRTRLATAQFEAQNVRDALSTNTEQLNHLMGRDPRIPFVVVPLAQPEETELDIAAAEDLALKQRPELKQQQIQVQKLLTQRKIILSHYIPNVSIALTSIESRNFQTTFPANYLAAGLFATWDGYDWNRKVFLAQAETIEARQQRLRLSDLIDNVLIDVRDRFRQLRLARQRVEVATMQRDAAQERLRVDTRRMQVGAAILSQVFDSQSTLANSDHVYMDSILALWSAKSEFDRAIGKDFI